VQVLHGIEGFGQLPPNGVVTIGNFDGVHRGHQHILRHCLSKKRPPPQPSPGIPGEGVSSSPLIVITFEPHPLTVLRPSAVPPRLTPPEKKQELIASLGADYYVIIPPTKSVLNLTAEQFWELLRDKVRPDYVIEGPGFNFGKDRKGTGKLLVEWARQSKTVVELLEPATVALLDLSLVSPSSSLIRWLVGHGRVRGAAICLGRPYGLIGKVVRGFGRGRTMGFPTANIETPGQVIPADGIYAGRCRVAGRDYAAAVSIGDLPTFGGGTRQIEAHLLDFADDLYGRDLEIELSDWLREQQKFGDVAALKAAIDRDIMETRRRAGMKAGEPIVSTEVVVGS
jgi:riboflavin kinase / FMN adenylyltransferase